jgi:hypothetical protein
MDVTNIGSAPDLMVQWANVTASLTAEDLQSDSDLHATCQGIRTACELLSTNVGELLSPDDTDDTDQSTNAEDDKVRWPKNYPCVREH